MHKTILLGITTFSLAAASGCAAKPEIAQSDSAKKTAVSQAYIKPGAGIGYSHDLKSQYVAGETVSFQLKLGESYRAGIMRVNITAEGVQLLAASGPANFDMSAGSEHEITVSFNAGANGRHYINVRAEADIGDGNPMSRVFSIPVQVGPVSAQKPNGNMETMPDGENIIGMDAAEEIK